MTPRARASRSAGLIAAALLCAWQAQAGRIKGSSVLENSPPKLWLDSAEAVSETIAVKRKPFRHATRVVVGRKPAYPWSVQLAVPMSSAVAKGDVLLGVFYARCADGPDCRARVEYRFKETEAPHRHSVRFLVNVGPKWNKYQVPFAVNEDFPLGAASILFNLGFGPQSVEIGGIETVAYSTATDIRKLPVSRVTYSGRQSGAAWRQSADWRIERIRKADLRISVKDKAGDPVPGAAVKVEMLRHAFAFGSAVDHRIIEDSEDGRLYRETLRALFNTASIENDLKWPLWEKNPERALAAVKWLRENALSVRGHTLVWAGWNHLPADVEGLKGDPEALRRRVASHIREQAGRLKGQVAEWDAVNENFEAHVFSDILGKDSILDWFKIAREADPGTKLILNESHIIEDDGANADAQRSLEETLRFLLERKAPVDAIGLQGHFSWLLTPPEKILEILDRYAVFDKPIKITEFDVDLPDEKTQADYTRDFLTAAFSHPAVAGITIWGFWADRYWRTNTPLFREDATIKPNGVVWKNLVLGKWWTKAGGDCDMKGRYATRGFLGEYRIDVAHQGRTKSQAVSLTRAGTDVEIVLD